MMANSLQVRLLPSNQVSLKEWVEGNGSDSPSTEF